MKISCTPINYSTKKTYIGYKIILKMGRDFDIIVDYFLHVVQVFWW